MRKRDAQAARDAEFLRQTTSSASGSRDAIYMRQPTSDPRGRYLEAQIAESFTGVPFMELTVGAVEEATEAVKQLGVAAAAAAPQAVPAGAHPWNLGSTV